MSDFESYMNSAAGQQAMATAGASGGRQILPSDLLDYLTATGQDKDPRWARVLAGDNPIGAPAYGWDGARTAVATPGRAPEPDVADESTADYMGPVANRSGTAGTRAGYMGPVADRNAPVPAAGVTSPGRVTTRNRDGTEVSWNAVGSQQPRLDVRAPLYFDGDADTEYNKMSPEQKALVKQRMRDTGLLAPDAGGIGAMWDSQAFSAFNEVLRFSNARGTSWRVSMSYMQDYLDQHPEEKKGPNLPAFVANVENPDDLRKVFEDAAIRVTGKGRADPAMVERYVKSYQDEQMRAQRQQYDATYSADTTTGTGSGGVVTAAPDADVAAENALRTENPAAAGGTDIANQFANFMDIIGGGLGG